LGVLKKREREGEEVGGEGKKMKIRGMLGWEKGGVVKEE
jgi:hypothetical protein